MDIYDRLGNPMSYEEWAIRLGDFEYKRVALTETPEPPIMISTVWLGLDHNFSFAGSRPLIFETMVFLNPNESMLDEECERYSTLEEAIEGHELMVHHVYGPHAEIALANTQWNVADAKFKTQ